MKNFAFSREIYLIITFIVILIGAYLALIWSPPEQTLGELIRVFYIHLPIAWTTYLAFGISLMGSIIYLVKKNQKFDRIAEVAAVLGLLYGSMTLITGSIWANAAWGTYWNWDPRETSTLILWIAYVGYLALRGSLQNFEKKTSLSAIYNIFAFTTVPLSYVSIIFWQTLHPQVITTGGISLATPMVITLLINLLAGTFVFVYIFRTFYKVRTLEYEQEIREGMDGE
jgi:heme exporter protein C